MPVPVDSAGGIATARRTVTSGCVFSMRRGFQYVGAGSRLILEIRRLRVPAVQIVLGRDEAVGFIPRFPAPLSGGGELLAIVSEDGGEINFTVGRGPAVTIILKAESKYGHTVDLRMVRSLTQSFS